MKKIFNKERLAFYLTVFLFFVFIALISFNFYLVIKGTNISLARSSTSCVDFNYQDRQTIYTRVDCRSDTCHCQGSGNKLFAFFGAKSNCDDLETQKDRFDCFLENSYSNYDCEDLLKMSDKEECLNKYVDYATAPYRYHVGEAGTFIHQGDLISRGIRTYIDGFKGEEHSVYTKFDRATPEPMITFIKNSRNIIFGPDLNIERGLEINSSYGGIFIDSKVSFGDINYINDEGVGHRVRGIETASRDKGVGTERRIDTDEEYVFIRTGHKNLITFSPGQDDISVEKGAQVHGNIKSSDMYLQDKRLYWSKPIRGNFILYYR